MEIQIMTDSEKLTTPRTSRRRFLTATAATGAFLGVGGMAYAQQGSNTTKYVLEGSAAAWVGVEPEDIAGEENPTLDVRVGQNFEE